MITFFLNNRVLAEKCKKRPNKEVTGPKYNVFRTLSGNVNDDVSH